MLARITQSGVKPNVYSLLDLTSAFNQLIFDEESAKLLVLNTHKGLLATKKLSFGVRTAPTLFQSIMDEILCGLENVFCYIDDIMLVSNNAREHLVLLRKVFERLNKFNVRLNKEKCKFFQSKIVYLGYELSSDGIRPVHDKVKAISDVQQPRCVADLKSWLGMITFYSHFIPTLDFVLVRFTETR
ncbi:Uncharacterised protein r2_g2538 [Pycnogonum litorale]